MTFDLYDRLAEGLNPTFSAFSIGIALSMLYAGAAAETEAAMNTSLHFGDNTAAFHKAFGDYALLVSRKDRSDTETKFLVSNVLWPNKDLALLEPFKKTLADSYAAKIVPLDFNNKEVGKKIINDAIAEQTQGEIKNLIQDLGANPELVITNALYFKSKWREPFKTVNTIEDNFHMTSGEKVTAKFMRQTSDFLYGEDEEMQIINLPYRDKDFAAIIILPKEGKLKEATKNLRTSYEATLAAMRMEEVSLSLPKFEQRHSLDLKSVLSDLGLGIIFSDDADFSKLAQKPLKVSAVLHEAIVKVDEEGTVAAAATAVIGRAAMSAAPRISKVFRADRPFIFQIIHRPSNVILFMVRIDKPLTQS